MNVVFWNNLDLQKSCKDHTPVNCLQPISPLDNILHFYSTFVKTKVLTLAHDRSFLTQSPDFFFPKSRFYSDSIYLLSIPCLSGL